MEYSLASTNISSPSVNSYLLPSSFKTPKKQTLLPSFPTAFPTPEQSCETRLSTQQFSHVVLPSNFRTLPVGELQREGLTD